VGREPELAALADRLRGPGGPGGRAEGGSDGGPAGGVVLVAGPAGVGKTTLVEAALRACGPAPVVRGWCPAEAAPPLWPWRAALRRAGFDRPAEPAGATEPAVAASARFAALAAASDALLGAGPLVVVLEDLHWADTASLDLLHQVAAGSSGSALTVVGTVRSPAPEDVAVRLAALTRYGALTLTLPPFTTAEVAALVGPAAAPAVHLRTGGLPLLVAAVRDGSGPGDVAAVVRTLLATLTPEQRTVLEAAAVLGDEVDEGLLAAVVKAADVGATLTSAWHGGLLTADGSRYRFVHALVRDGIIDRLEPSVARRLHRSAAIALDAAEATGGAGSAGRIAAHWRRAGTDPDTLRAAAAWSRRAGEQARAAHAYDDAVRHLDEALADLTLLPDVVDRATTTIELAHAEYLAGRYDRCLVHCADAADLAETIGRGDLVAQAALVLQGVTYDEAAHVVPRLCRRALDHPDVPDALRARLLAQLAVMAADSGRISDALPPARAALALAEAAGDPVAEVEAARAREMTLIAPSDTPERLRLGDLVADRAEVNGQPLAAVIGHGWRMAAGYATGRIEIATDAMAAVERIAGRTQLPLVRWHMHRARAARALLVGAFAESVAQSRQATAIARESGDTTAAAMHFAHGIRLAVVRGAPDALPEGYREAVANAPQMPLVLVQAANAHTLTGALDEARDYYARLVSGFPVPAEHPAWPAVLIEAAGLVHRFGDAATAETAFRQLLPFRPYPGPLGAPTVYFLGTVSRYLGLLAATMGNRADAEELFREAIARNRAVGARPDLAAASLDLAGVLRDGQPSRAGLAEAAALARDALGLAVRLDMPGTVAAAGRLAAEIAADRDEVDPLTAREREVAELVADALSNRQIAERLVLSERTVESHVRSILAKTGCANRTEFTARWPRSRQGL
jgi:DNA-binding CsgD family transcriptional regulator